MDRAARPPHSATGRGDLRAGRGRRGRCADSRCGAAQGRGALAVLRHGCSL